MTKTGTPGGPGGALAWDDWTPVPGVGDIAPGVALVASPATAGFTAYVVRASDQAVLAIGYANKAWTAPKQTPLSGVPTAAATGDGTPYVFVRGGSGGIQVMNGTSALTGVIQGRSAGLDSALPPGAAATADGKIALVTAVSPTKLRIAYSG
jgi:hypothetical protein